MGIPLASHAVSPSPWHELIGPLPSARLPSQHDGQSELNGDSVASGRAPSRTIPHPFTQLPLPKGVGPRLLAPSIKLEKEEFFARAPTDWSSLAERHPYLLESGIQLVQLLGRGGQGDVYLGWDHERKEAVAVKYAAGFSDKRKGFQAEKELTEAVTGVRVPRILDHLSTQNAEYLVLSPYLKKEKSEILPGTLSGAPSLKVALKEASKSGPSLGALRDLLPTLMEIAQLVERVHEQGVLHRDLRPQNILISEGRPVLIDFGNGAFLNSSQRYDGAELSKGTPGYVAPEYLKATSGSLTEKGDIYAFGVILYEALTGRVPFPAGKPAHVVHFSVCTKTPPAPHEVNPIVSSGLSQLCMQCLAPEPSERPRSAGVVGRILRAVA